MRAGRWVGGGRERTGRARAREGYQGGGEGRGGKGKRKGRGGGAQGIDVRVCVCLQDKSLMRSALHKASEKGLAGTVAQLLSLGADAALKDEVRACTCMRTWSYTYSMRVYSRGAYIRLCYKNRHIHT